MSQSEWIERYPNKRPLYLRDADGVRHTVRGTEQYELPDEPATTAEYEERTREKRTRAAMAAIANALDTTPEELAGVVQVERAGEVDIFGNPRPWLDAEPTPVVEPPKPRPWLDEPGQEATGADDQQEYGRGKVGQGQAERFAESKGFVSRRNRPSQTYAGRRKRHLAADVKSGHCTSLAQAAQRHPPSKRHQEDPDQ